MPVSRCDGLKLAVLETLALPNPVTNLIETRTPWLMVMGTAVLASPTRNVEPVSRLSSARNSSSKRVVLRQHQNSQLNPKCPMHRKMIARTSKINAGVAVAAAHEAVVDVMDVGPRLLNPGYRTLILASVSPILSLTL